MQHRRPLLSVGVVVLIAVLSFLAVHSSSDSPVAHWWPASAVGVCLLVLAPRRYWPLLSLGVLVAISLGNLTGGHSAGQSFLYGLADLLEVLITAQLLTRHAPGQRPQLRSWAEYRTLLVAIGCGSVVAALLIGVTTNGSQSFSHPGWTLLVGVLLNHLAGQAVIVPVALIRPPFGAAAMSEVALHLTLLAAATAICFSPANGRPLAYLMVPMLVWAASRFRGLWANIELIAMAVLITSLSRLGLGPFTGQSGPPTWEDLVSGSPLFLFVTALMSLAFATAVSQEYASAQRVLDTQVITQQLVDAAESTAFIATDLDGVITVFNPAAEDLLGYTATEVVGVQTPRLYHDRAELKARARELGTRANTEMVEASLARGSKYDSRDWTYICKDGTRKVCSVRASIVRDAAGAPTSYLAIAHDVTSQRAAEAQLVSALEKEREANIRMVEVDRAKVEFVSTVSHELRTPLTSIIGYVELLDEGVSGELAPAQRELVERIERNSDRLLLLVEDLLTMAQVQEGTFALSPQQIDMRTPLTSAVDVTLPSAAQAGVRLRLILPDQPVVVNADSTQLERLTLNLVSNAVKFTPAGGSVQVTLAQIESASGAEAELRVADTGMGIPKADHAKVFERFFRSSMATEMAVQGTGLGLNIVESIAQAHQGIVGFESSEGQGTTFWFRMPIEAAVVTAYDADQVPRAVSS